MAEQNYSLEKVVEIMNALLEQLGYGKIKALCLMTNGVEISEITYKANYQ